MLQTTDMTENAKGQKDDTTVRVETPHAGGGYNKLYSKLLRPIVKDLPLTAGLTCMSMACPAILCALNHYVKLLLQLLPLHLASAYVAVLLCGLLRGAWRKTALLLIFILFFASSCADAFYVSQVNWLFDTDSIALIIATSGSEISEFFSTYLTAEVMTYALFAALAYVAGWFVARRFRPSKGFAAAVVIAMVVAVIAECFAFKPLRLSSPSATIPLTTPGRAFLFATFDVPGPIEPKPFEVSTPNNMPDIVVIVGESLNRGHCSLYGYEKNTMPHLGAMADSVLLRFDSVTAAESHTQESFMRMMSFDGCGPDPEHSWRTSPSLPDIMREAGYATLWISNQSRYGAYENVPSRFAARCDSAHWVSDMYLGLKSSTLDGELADAMRNYLYTEKPGRLFAVVHCMGSHFDFSERYDPRQAVFAARDYAEKPANQRTNLDHYDNSIVHTDSVVAEIMHLFDRRDAIVLFFPDHGFDIYCSAPDALIHVRNGSAESMRASRDIPLVAYITDSLRLKYPEIQTRLQQMKEKSFCTDALTQIVASVSGIEIRTKPQQ